MNKSCIKCDLEKDKNDFSPGQFALKNSTCRLCKKEYDQNRYEDNKSDINRQSKEYRENNKDKVRAFKREYSINNRELFKNNLKTFRVRHANDPVYRIRNNISSNISHLLRQANGSKNGKSIFDYMSYSFKELMDHLEKQFESWMNWNNYGSYDQSTWDDNDQSTWTWSLDHIIPQTDLPYSSMEDDNFKKCWALNNLRPLSAKQNLIDGVNKSRHQGVK
jgi:hypothetical protein